MEVLHFLLPFHISPFSYEILPSVFFVIIWGLLIWTVVGIYRKANEKSWEKNWHFDDKAKLDAEHSSVIEVCEAVATNAEKSANIMPGTLLIIGLLGTFIGLGLALDKASLILIDSATADSIDSSIANLMGMLEGLGAKFKTSTWGLLAFILLKVILSNNGYEERRLRWSIEKVKTELDFVRDKERQEDRANNQKLVDCMQTIAQQFQTALVANQADNQKQLQQIVKHNQAMIETAQKGHQEQLARLMEQEKNIVGVLQLSADKQQELINEINLGNQKTQETTRQHFKVLADTLNKHHEATSTFLQDNIQQSKETRDAMVGFVEKNEATVAMLGKSAEGMSIAAENMSNAGNVMGEAAGHLQDVIDKFRMNMEQVVDLMKEDLNATIAGMNTSFSQNMTSMSDSLKSSIGNMSDSFKANMSEMSKGLGQATHDISNAVNSLSTSVDATMTEVTNTINTSMDLQKNAQKKFIESTDTLNEHVHGMTNLVDKLSEDIRGGLKSVSESNLRMKGVASNIEQLAQAFPEGHLKIIDVANHIEQLAASIGGYLDELSKSNKTMLELKPALNGLKDSIAAQSKGLFEALNSGQLSSKALE